MRQQVWSHFFASSMDLEIHAGDDHLLGAQEAPSTIISLCLMVAVRDMSQSLVFKEKSRFGTLTTRMSSSIFDKRLGGTFE